MPNYFPRRFPLLRPAFAFGLLLVLVGLSYGRASALPVFAHRYGLSCQACHTIIPQLNAFGERFLANGFQLPGARGDFPIAIKTNLAYSSAVDPSGLPKAIVDEVEVLSGGTLGNNTSYWMEQYVLDGGRSGQPRDMWLEIAGKHAPFSDGSIFRAKIGQFTLPLPIDPETQRPTQAHYLIFDQNVGANPFTLFEPRIGLDLSSQSLRTGLSAHLVAVESYDRGMAMPHSGIDLMASLAADRGPISLSAYRYSGQRVVLSTSDRFARTGVSLRYRHRRVGIALLAQQGTDTNADGFGTFAHSSGGFVQALYDISSAMTIYARKDTIADDIAGFTGSSVISLVMRPAKRVRFTLEAQRTAQTTQFATGLEFAY